MAKIRIDTNGITELKTIVTTMQKQSADALIDIASAKSCLDIKTASSENIYYRISRLHTRVQAQEAKLRQYNTILERVVEQFIASDKSVASHAKGINYLLDRIIATPYSLSRNSLEINAEISDILDLLHLFDAGHLGIFNSVLNGFSPLNGIVNTLENVSSKLWDAVGETIDETSLLDVLSEAGFVGSTLALALGVVNDQSATNLGKSALDGIKLTASTMGKIAGRKAVNMFGTNTVDAIGFKENLAGSLDDYVYNSKYNSLNMTGAQQTWRNVGTIAKWGGIAISALGNFADNIEEYKGDFSNSKMYLETAGETVVDVGVGLLVGAGVATLAGATAPVWAVGVVTTGAVMTLDVISEIAFGAELSEAASDAFILAGESIADGAAYVGEKIIEGVSSIGESIADGISSVGKGFSSMTSNIFAKWK